MSTTTTPIKLLEIAELSALICRPIPTILSQRCRTPEVLPQPVTLPGCRRLLWHPDDVQAWIDQHRHRQSRHVEQASADVEQPRRRGRPRKITAQK